MYANQNPENGHLLSYFDNRQAIIAIRNPKSLPQPNQMSVRNQIPSAYRVECPQDQLRLQSIPDQLGDPLPHLPAGLDRERAADDVLWTVAMVRE